MDQMYEQQKSLHHKIANALVRLPFKDRSVLDKLDLGDSFAPSLQILNHKEKRFEKNERFKELYARLIWIFWYPQRAFGSEISQLLKNKELKSNNQLISLSPFLEKGLVRVGGRLSNASLETEQKTPFILHSQGIFVRLMIEDMHKKTLHGGTQLGSLRQHYWITRGRNAVKSVISKCKICTRFKGASMQQKMGDLSSYSVSPSFPFEKSGIDYAGPILLRQSKGRGNKAKFKAYIAIFICLSTRACHLELTEDYRAEAFVEAFKRFTARRGHCAELVSDQGTNFIQANTELQRLFIHSLNETKKFSYLLAKDGTKWSFNPPGAPHFGGIWESAVKSAKHHIRRVIGDHTLTVIEFSTLLCQVEACLNSRLLLPLRDDPSDLDPLTPAHFLIQRSSFLVPEPNSSLTRVSLTKRWELIATMAQNFWKRWSAEYLTSLYQRSKWRKVRDSVQVGDLVIIKSKLTPLSKWPHARVLKIHPNKHGLTRVVTLKTKTSTMQRPIVKLILLHRGEES